MAERIIRSKEEIDDLIAGGDKKLSGYSVEYYGELDLSSFDHIEDSTFKGPVHFSHRESVSIVGSVFHAKVTFFRVGRNSETDNISHKYADVDVISENEFHGEVNFYEVNLRRLTNNKFLREVWFYETEISQITDNTVLKNISFFNAKIGNLSNNKFYGLVDLPLIEVREVKNNEFYKECRAAGEMGDFIQNTLHEQIWFIGLKFKKFRHNKFPGGMSFVGVEFEEELTVISSNADNLTFWSCTFGDTTITIQNDTSFSIIKIQSCEFKSKFKIRTEEIRYNSELKKYKGVVGEPVESQDKYIYEQAHKARIQKLEIADCTATNEAYIRIGYLDIGRFFLGNLRNPSGAEVNIDDCRFENFRMDNFRNLGKFKLYNINILRKEKYGNGEFNINNTSIGDTDFQRINLASFDEVRMFDNTLDGIKYTSVDWPKTVEVGQIFEYEEVKRLRRDELAGQTQRDEAATQPPGDEAVTQPPGDEAVGQHQRDEVAKLLDDEEIKHSKKRDTYRILKNVAQQNHDAPQALIFYAKEMQSHKEFIRIRDGGRISIDRATLWFNETTNNFGLDWLRPICWLLDIGVIAYAFLLASLDMSFLDHIGKFFVFLNPTHKTEFIAEGCWWGLTYFIDFSFRIIEGTLIYQAIIAFRKFSRKV